MFGLTVLFFLLRLSSPYVSIYLNDNSYVCDLLKPAVEHMFSNFEVLIFYSFYQLKSYSCINTILTVVNVLIAIIDLSNSKACCFHSIFLYYHHLIISTGLLLMIVVVLLCIFDVLNNDFILQMHLTINFYKKLLKIFWKEECAKFLYMISKLILGILGFILV